MRRTMKKLGAIVLTLAMLLSSLVAMPLTISATEENFDVWNGSTTSQPIGAGTKSNPYQIADGADLAWVSANAANFTAADTYLTLTADINLGNQDFTPIAAPNAVNVAGNDYTISGLKVSDYADAGLFSVLNGGEITDLHFVNSTIDAKAAKSSTAGLLAGTVKGTVVVTGCTTDASSAVSGNLAGGFIGLTYKSGPATLTFDKCVNRASVEGRIDGGGSPYAGGFLGRQGSVSSATFTYCVNKGAITAHAVPEGISTHIGGLLAESRYVDPNTDTTTFESCYNVGSLTIVMDSGTTTENVVMGGIVGWQCNKNFTMTNCYDYSMRDLGGANGTYNSALVGDGVDEDTDKYFTDVYAVNHPESAAPYTKIVSTKFIGTSANVKLAENFDNTLNVESALTSTITVTEGVSTPLAEMTKIAAVAGTTAPKLPGGEGEEDTPQFIVENNMSLTGTEVAISVYVANNPGVVSMRIKPQYDSNVLELISANDAGLLQGYTGLTDSGVVSWYDRATTINNTANGKLVTFTFRVKDNATPGTTTVSITYETNDVFDLDRQPVEFACVDGTLRMSEYLCGDVNRDGEVDAADVAFVRRHLVGWKDYLEICTEAADVSNDGAVNAIDVAILRRYLANWEGVELLCHDMQQIAEQVEATCERDGLTAVYACATCNKTEGGEVIPAIGHNMQQSSAQVDPTCEGNGLTAIYSCTRCGRIEGGDEIDALGHNFEAGVCTRCGDDHPHNWGDGVITIPATQTTEGLKTFTCSCGKTKTETIPVLKSSINVATYNILQCANLKDPTMANKEGAADPDKYVQVILDNQIDIIGMNEVGINCRRSAGTGEYYYDYKSNQPEYIAAKLTEQTGDQYYWAFATAIKTCGKLPAAQTNYEAKYGNAIVSRYPINSIREIQVYAHDYDPTRPDTQYQHVAQWNCDYEVRSILIAEINVNGTIITAICTHFGLLDDEMLLMSQRLQEVIAEIDTPVLLMGDFNMKTTHLNIIKDINKILNIAGGIDNTDATFPQKNSRIDYIFASDDFIMTNYKVLSDIEYSDHCPVTVTVKLKN